MADRASAHRSAPGARGPLLAVLFGPAGAPTPAVGRVTNRATFDALRSARWTRRGTLSVKFVAIADDVLPRVAYAIGRSAGGAVARNRLRRRLRAAVHDLAAELTPGSYLVGAGRDAFGRPYAELLEDLSAAIRGAA